MTNNIEILLRNNIVALAQGLEELKVRETGNNAGEVVNQLLLRADAKIGDPWCVVTYDYEFETSCKALGIKPFINPGASTSEFARRADKIGRLLLTPEKAKYGDAVLFLTETGGREYNGFKYKHTGTLIKGPDKDGNFVSSEGNVGDRVQRLTHNLKTSPAHFVSIALPDQQAQPADNQPLPKELMLAIEPAMRILYNLNNKLGLTAEAQAQAQAALNQYNKVLVEAGLKD